MALPIANGYDTLEGHLGRQRGPLYKRLAGALRDAIESGDFSPGSLLPAERTLATSLKVSRVTVVAAYEALREEGLVERRRGSGTRVVRRPPGAEPWVGTSIQQLRGHGPIPGEYLDVPFDGVAFTVAALPGVEAISDMATTVAATQLPRLLSEFGYAPYGFGPLREGLADRHTADGLDTRPDEILITAGAQQALSLLSLLLVGPGGVAVVEDPTYVGVLDALRAVGATPIGVPVDAGGVQVEPLARLTATTAPKLIYLIASYHNPTGVVLSESRAEEIARIASRYRVPIIDDRSLSALGWGHGPRPPIFAEFGDRDVITVGSLSKLTWGGLRVGWIRAPAPLIDQLARLKMAVDHGSSIISQAIAATLLPQLDRLTKDRQRMAAERYEGLADALRRHLPEWRWTRPAGGLSVWVRAPGISAAPFAEIARRNGVIVVTGPAFSAAGGHEDRLRLTFGDEPATIEAGVQALARAWKEWIESDQSRRPPLDIVV